MHRGCLVWTPTPPLAGRRPPRPGPVRVCVCSSFLAGSGGPASLTRSGAPHLFLWPLCVSALLVPSGLGLPLSRSSFFSVFCFLRAPYVSCFLWFPAPGASALGTSFFFPPIPPACVFFFFLSFSLFFLPSPPPLSLAFFGFRPRVPWALALCVVCSAGLPLLGSPCPLASFVSPARPLAAPWWLPPPPPPLLCLAVFVAAARCLVFFSFSFPFLSAPPLSLAFSRFPPRVPQALALCVVCFVGLPLLGSLCTLASSVFPAWPLAAPSWLLPPPPPCVSRFLSLPPGAPFFFPPSLCAPFVSGFLWFPAPPALGLRAVCCLLCWPPASRLSVRSRLVCVSRLAVGCSLVAAAPPTLSWLAIFVAAAWCCVPCAVPCCVSLGVVRRAVARCAVRCCAVVYCVVLLPSFGAAACCAVPCGAACRPEALCVAALCFAVFPRAVCSVLCVFCRGVLVRAVSRRCALCCVCPRVLCCAFPVLSALWGAVLRCAGALALCCSCGACCCWRLVLWCAAVCCAVSFGVLWCSAGSGDPWMSAGGVFRSRCFCLAAWSASLWLVWFAVVPCLPVSCCVVLCCHVMLCCCALASFCGAVCACFALLWPVMLCCVVLMVVCAVFCLVVVSVCCGALFLPTGTHKNIDYDPVLPRAHLSVFGSRR